MMKTVMMAILEADRDDKGDHDVDIGDDEDDDDQRPRRFC